MSLHVRTTVLLTAGLLLLACVLVLSAWLCDDAYITFRTIENLVTGHGARWNVIERVQSYTHPLWMLILAGLRAMTGEIYYTSIITSLVLSLGAALLMVRSAVDRGRVAPLLILALVMSRSFVDYSTSGLENPLTHLLLVLFLRRWWISHRAPADTDLRLLWALAAGVLLCRLDLILLLGPLLGSLFWSRRDKAGLRAAVVGASPLIAWEVFSVIYYGVPFPNTAYAKLGAGIPWFDYVKQGGMYLGDSTLFDPVIALVIVAGLVAGYGSRRRGDLLVAVGTTLYLLYVVRIGGDFMAGRFLTAPLVAALMILGRRTLSSLRYALTAALVIVAVGLWAPRPVLLSGPDFGLDVEKAVGDHGIADERAFYYPTTGLLRAQRGAYHIDHPWAMNGRRAQRSGRPVVSKRTIGFFGFFAGPGVHVIDRFGLSDPLVARIQLPAGSEWRIGHILRDIPAGYMESALWASSAVVDPELAAFDDKLRLVTRGPLFTSARWRAIVELNTP